jgi:hypothetical protein
MKDEPSGTIAIVLLVTIAIITIALGSIKTAYASEPYEYQLRAWIDKLVQEESGGREDIQIIDSNGLHSRGCLMFQDRTWEYQTEKHGMQQADKFSCEDQKELAYRMINNRYNEWANWRCSVVDTVDSEVCTVAFKKMNWKPKKGIGKPPVKPKIEIIETDNNEDFCLL